MSAAVNEIGAPLREAKRPPGCRGAACPLFDACRGRCATPPPPPPPTAPDGGIWIETR